ncbi:Glucose-6-phosphate 1-dehydrogenase [Fundidesulfovibrio magnetotacticus]|uniref:Glucose-6-phosphate 1-dehydrogenase n=1 Tax=Fundidesulfovibrio magnetotacticus TaxID=2730080 RepID=A0A6V8LN04_9BACT|nr:glucose-6-phosphate dehydrogenase [Fundidesulfovibrio magnetotacticus]GFK94033.1 Glucose-6-phosphate 1-dehydrogenase [Fundidesulfovibrio magnetotacticus]
MNPFQPGVSPDVMECRLPERPQPCAVVIFGASGDLTSRKLIPALARIYRAGDLPDNFAIVGAARTPMTTEAFREKAREWLAAAGHLDGLDWEGLARRLFYHSMDYADLEGYRGLGKALADAEAQLGLPGNRMFYLAIPPTLYEAVAVNLGEAGLAGQDTPEGWTRIVVEKPFGRDLESSRKLDRAMHQHFQEGQIFRIDHYLAKETVQNVLLFRFANAVFEPVWNRNYVDYVSILAAESLGVEHRAGYYEEAGVLRDMFQNHMMQLLSLAAMEPPSVFRAREVLDEKTKLYRSLRPFDPEKGFGHLVLGQYGPSADGSLPAYRQEPGVSPSSLTPTFAMLKAYVDNWRWQGVPFYICSGKRLAGKITRMVVQFKEVPHSIYRNVVGEHVSANRLIMEVYPNETIHLSLQAKQSGEGFCLRTASMSFDFKGGYAGPPVDSYEKVILDCMLGDHMLFWRQDGVELSWAYLTPILELCEQQVEMEKNLFLYPAGSWGPRDASMVHLNYLKDLTGNVRA